LNNPYRQLLDWGLLRQTDTGNGRFVIHAGVFDMNGRELQGIDVPFTAHYPGSAPPPPPGGKIIFQPVAPGNVPPPPPPPGGGPVRGGVPPPPPGQPQERDCGTGLDDPGCMTTRGGDLPMDRRVFEGFVQALRGTLSESTRVTMVSDMMRARFITARQLGALMDLFIGENNRLDAVRSAMPHVVDPANAAGYATKFISAGRQREFNQLVASQR
jgi:hypothetical protein